MEHDFLRRNQRSTKRACMKLTLQIMLLLLSVWLLYQINKLRANRIVNFGGEITVLEEYGIISLGRKVIPSSLWLNQIPHVEAESENRTGEEKSRSESDKKDNKFIENIDVHVNDDEEEKDETERFYRFHDENGVPPEEEGNEIKQV